MIELREATKKYNVYGNEIIALCKINLKIQQGELIAVIGASGSGKSTLLNILGGMDLLTSGNYFFDGTDVSQYSMAQLHRFRKQNIGFVFQNFALINRYTVYENLEVPLIARNKKNYKKKIMDCLEKMGIAEYAKNYPPFLSGGQQQRCAIGRALMTDCKLLLCDEPTGALDRKMSEDIMNVLCESNKEEKTIIIVTHDSKIAAKCKRQISLEDGKIII